MTSVTIRRLQTLILFGFIVSSSNGQGGVHAPTGGFVLDSRSGTIRVVQGILGGATLGVALPLPFKVRRFEVSPSGDYALVQAQSERSEWYVVADGSWNELPGTGASSNRDLIQLGNGGSFAMYQPSEQRILIYGGLPVAPALLYAESVSAVASIALDSDGIHLAVGRVLADLTGAIDVISTRGERQAPVILHCQPLAMRFVPDGQLYFADACGGVGFVRDAGTQMVIEDVTSPDTSRDELARRTVQVIGATVVVVDSQSDALSVIDIATGEVRSRRTLPFHPNCFSFSGIPGLYSMREAGPGPAYFLSSESDMQTFFVPLD